MTPPRALAELKRLRRRARDEAQRRLVAARARQVALEERRRGWRRHVEAEAAAAGEDPRAIGRWLEGCRWRERALADEAAALVGEVAAAGRAHRQAELELEQLETLEARARTATRRATLHREQRWLDDLGPMRGL